MSQPPSTEAATAKGAAMKQVGSVIKIVGKWSIILGAIYIGTTLLSGVDRETRTGWFFGAFAMAIGYVYITQKDRITNLEFRVDELTRRMGGH
jgi:hypothetical protein